MRGAAYVGVLSHVEFRRCAFIRNEAEYVGGACYFFDTDYREHEGPYESNIVHSLLIENRAKGNGGGGGIYLDGRSRLNLTDVRFIVNHAGPDSTDPTGAGKQGQSLLDASHFAESSGHSLSGLLFHGKVEFCQRGVDPSRDQRRDPGELPHDVFQPDPNEEALMEELRHDLREKEERPEAVNLSLALASGRISKPEVIPIVSSPMADLRCYGDKPRPPDVIDTVVIHHTSAIFWEDRAFQDQFAKQIARFETQVGRLPPEQRKYDWRYCKELYELYGVSAHYLIDRDGVIRQLVPEELVAYHAGESRMPSPDSRTNVNSFSIGIELISSHPDDDPDVRQGGPHSAYTEAQYKSLHYLLLDLCAKYPIRLGNLVGHDEITGGRKKDPGPLFDWARVRKILKRDLAQWRPEP